MRGEEAVGTWERQGMAPGEGRERISVLKVARISEWAAGNKSIEDHGCSSFELRL